jgi:hypothetical protein
MCSCAASYAFGERNASREVVPPECVCERPPVAPGFAKIRQCRRVATFGQLPAILIEQQIVMVPLWNRQPQQRLQQAMDMA